jgi:hypothetical protein
VRSGLKDIVVVEPSPVAADALRQRWRAAGLSGLAVVEATAQALGDMALGLGGRARQFSLVVDKVGGQASGRAGGRAAVRCGAVGVGWALVLTI